MMDEFLKACGAAGPMLLEVEGGGEVDPVRRVIPAPYAILGRHPQADVVLRHEAVGQRHAYLQVVGGRIACIDLESRTGTRVGGRDEAQSWVEPDDWIEVGPYRVRARLADAPGLTASAGDPPIWQGGDDPRPLSGAYARRRPEAGPTPVLEIRDARGDGVDYRLSRVLTLVGAARLCKIRLLEAGASRFAGALLRTAGAVWAVDLLASDRLRYDGQAIRHCRLEPGQALHVGPYAIRLTGDPGSEPSRVGPAAGELATVIQRSKTRAIRRSGPEGDVPEAVLGTVLDQVAQMQKQMSDQFQQTMLMMAQLFGSMHTDHMEAVREELAQIRRLTEQMEALRRAPAAAPTTAREGSAAAAEPSRGPAPSTAPAAPPPAIDGGGGGGREPATERPDAIAVQVLVGQRLAAYERERQSRWGKVLRLLGGS